MIEYDELKNAQSIMDETYEKFENLTHWQIKQNLVDALWLVNHFIQLNNDTTRAAEASRVDPPCPCGKYHEGRSLELKGRKNK